MAEFSVKTDKLTGAAMDLGGVNTSLQDIYTSLYSVKGNLGFKVRSLAGIERALNQAASEISQERMLCVSMKTATTNVAKAYSSAEDRILSNAKEGKKIKEAQSIPVAGVGAAMGAGVVVGAAAYGNFVAGSTDGSVSGGGGAGGGGSALGKENNPAEYGTLWDYIKASAIEDIEDFGFLDAADIVDDFKDLGKLGIALGPLGFIDDIKDVYEESDGDLMEVTIRCTAHAVIGEVTKYYALSWLMWMIMPEICMYGMAEKSRRN